MGLCCVPGCDERISSFYRFPNPNGLNADELYEKWLKNIKNSKLNDSDKEAIYNKVRVCRKHFASDCFSDRRTLNFMSVPTLCLPQTIDNVPSRIEANKVMASGRCSIPDCIYKGSGDRSASFPQNDPELFKVWIRAVNNPLLIGKTMEQIRRQYRVCSKHFEDKHLRKDYYLGSTKKVLFPGAYPTLHLDRDKRSALLGICEEIYGSWGLFYLFSSGSQCVNFNNMAKRLN